MAVRLCQNTTAPQKTIALPRSDPATASVFGGGFSTRPDRTSPRALVEVEGRDIKKSGFAPLISRVEVVDEIGKISRARVTITDPDGKFMNDPLWLEGRLMRLSLGYPTTQLVSRGNFVITTPHFEFGAKQRIELSCYGEEIKLTRDEKRRAFNNLTDSDIVAQIASEHGFTTNLDVTTIKYPQVVQANVSDGQFISERAKLYGFEFYVENGAIHFHAPRAESTGIVLQYRDGQASTLSSLSVGVSPSYRALTASLTEVDSLTGEVFDASSRELQDEITSTSIQSAKADGMSTRTHKEIAQTYGGGQKFVVGGGHLQQRAARLPEAEGLSRLSRWVVEAHGESEGLEGLSVRKTLKILGAGRWSGSYRIVKAVHSFRPGYRVEFELARTWTGNPTAESSPLPDDSNTSFGGGLTDVSGESRLAGVAIERP